MRKFTFANVSLLLTLLQTSFADTLQQIEQSTNGCNFVNPTLTHGFTGTFYQYDIDTFNPDSVLYDGQYLSQPIIGTFPENDHDVLNIVTEETEPFGPYIKDTPFLVEKLGYFYGMY